MTIQSGMIRSEQALGIGKIKAEVLTAQWPRKPTHPYGDLGDHVRIHDSKIVTAMPRREEIRVRGMASEWRQPFRFYPSVNLAGDRHGGQKRLSSASAYLVRIVFQIYNNWLDLIDVEQYSNRNE